jgi:hypothetical protein
MTDEQSTIHKFDREVACVYGIVPAIIYQYICWRSVNSPVRWITFTLEELSEQYPYLTYAQVRNAVDRLIYPHGKNPALVTRRGKRGSSFLYAPVCESPVVTRWTKFDTGLAARLGLVPAIIYYNVGYWIKKNWDDHATERAAYYDPAKFDFDVDRLNAQAYQDTRDSAAHFCYIDQWVKERPFISRRSAFYGFSRLLKANLLVKTHLRDRQPLWGFTDKEAKKHIAKSLIANEGRDSNAGLTESVQNQQSQCRISRASALSTVDSSSSDSLSRECPPVQSSTSEAPVVRCANQKQVKENVDAFRRSLAGARSAAGTASSGPSAKLALGRKIRRDLNRPNLPVYKEHGSPVKRSYHRQPVPQNEFDLNVMDDMTPEQRAAYVRQ